ncbi:MAG: recombinase family protein [Clostridia bacterium]|nr:recombinase family protein [Clostridia bacterium]
MSKIEYNAALYLRLSKEDGDKEESDSIANQRALGLHFIKKNPDVKLYKEFIDDGYTGSNFDRPNFQDMIDLILKGKINCVIVKDLSRFAREYIDAGYYLEKLFPAMGVRFISINDNIDYKVDSSNNTKLIVAFKNILNDSYIRDTSIKIRSHLEVKRQSG